MRTPTVISLQKERFIRFAVWVLAMFAANLAALGFAPHKIYFIPVLSMAFFAPMVIMPLRRNQGGKSDV